MKHSGVCICGYETPLVEDREDIDWDLLDIHQEFCKAVEGEEERLGKAEERYEKMCIEQDEGQPNDNDSGWEQ